MTTRQDSALQQHPLSAAFPSMQDDDVAALAEDISKHGQREPGVLYEGQVLDGWHRFRACYLAGVPFKSMEFDGQDPRAFVLSRNLHRRHLTAGQKASAIVAVSNWRPDGVAAGPATVATLTNAEMAEQAEVSERTIRHAKAAEKAGLGPEVRDGKVSVERAASVASLSPKKRAKAVRAIKDGEKPAPRKTTTDDAKLRAELIEVQGKYADLAEKNADLADTARDLQDKLEMYEAKETDEQQKLIASLQKRIKKLEGEVDRLTIARNDAQSKNNQLIAEVKRLKKKAGE